MIERSSDQPELRAQVPSLRVVGDCDCGCPSIWFAPTTGGRVGVAHAVVDDRDTVILFTDAQGLLVGLDYAWTTDQPPREFPPPSQLGAT